MVSSYPFNRSERMGVEADEAGGKWGVKMEEGIKNYYAFFPFGIKGQL